jgi:hypothetical protein
MFARAGIAGLEPGFPKRCLSVFGVKYMLNSRWMIALALSAVAGRAQAGIPKNVMSEGSCDGFTGLVDTGQATIAGNQDASACDGVTVIAAGGPPGKNLLDSGLGLALTLDSDATAGVRVGVVLNNDHSWAAQDATGTMYPGGTGSKRKPGSVSLVGAKAAGWVR